MPNAALYTVWLFLRTFDSCTFCTYSEPVVHFFFFWNLNNEFCWNDDNQTCEVYLITFEDSQVQINQMTDFIKEKIKQGYNIHQLYDAGKFVPKEISPSAE